MKKFARYILAAVLMVISVAAFADDYSDTVSLFKKSNQSADYFRGSYGYAVFPTVGEGGFVVAGGHGTGRVYVHGRYVGDAAMTQVSVGAQAGAQAYSQIVFFANRKAFEDFASGNFEFGAGASAVAITASADASVGTQGLSASAGTSKKNAGTKGTYIDGTAVFTIVKGGAMLQASIGGQKFSYKPKAR